MFSGKVNGFERIHSDVRMRFSTTKDHLMGRVWYVSLSIRWEIKYRASGCFWVGDDRHARSEGGAAPSRLQMSEEKGPWSLCRCTGLRLPHTVPPAQSGTALGSDSSTLMKSTELQKVLGPRPVPAPGSVT